VRYTVEEVVDSVEFVPWGSKGALLEMIAGERRASSYP